MDVQEENEETLWQQLYCPILSREDVCMSSYIIVCVGITFVFSIWKVKNKLNKQGSWWPFRVKLKSFHISTAYTTENVALCFWRRYKSLLCECHWPSKNKDLLFSELRKFDNMGFVNEYRCNLTNLILHFWAAQHGEHLQPQSSVFYHLCFTTVDHAKKNTARWSPTENQWQQVCGPVIQSSFILGWVAFVNSKNNEWMNGSFILIKWPIPCQIKCIIAHINQDFHSFSFKRKNNHCTPQTVHVPKQENSNYGDKF